ncbi:hypothetical protein Tco_1170089 [Tanacetum coccineum]
MSTMLSSDATYSNGDKKTNEDEGDELDNIKTDGGLLEYCECYLKGDSGNSRGKRLAISMVVEAWLSEKEEV